LSPSRKNKQASLALHTGPSERDIVLQRSPIAGYRHHEAPLLWAALHPRLAITMAREPRNPRDTDAVALFWRGRKLGYLPRGENFMVARLLEGNRPLSARIRRLTPTADRNHRIHIEVLLH
jgi:hypothetical protein